MKQRLWRTVGLSFHAVRVGHADRHRVDVVHTAIAMREEPRRLVVEPQPGRLSVRAVPER